jgi:TM2 domain-containing membrane protein YozV
VCPACSTPHHKECWEENGGCTVFGCAEAPVEEAKVVVTGADFGPGGYAGGQPLQTTGVAPPPPQGVPGTGSEEALVPGKSVAHGMLGLAELPATPISLTGIDVAPSTDRRTYILLAFLFGYLGVHNLYANRMSVGIMQLCVTVLTCFLAAPLTWIWALTEVFGVREDGDGNRML